METRNLIILAGLVGLVACSVSGQRGTSMQERINRAKSGTVRVLVNGNPAGSGFAVAKNLIVTDFHVVQSMTPTPTGQTQIGYAGTIQVQLQDGRTLPATPHATVLGQGLQYAIGKDVALLSVQVDDLAPLRLGRFSDVKEGDSIYLVGYPLGVEQSIVAVGIVSTKWKTSGYLGQGGDRDVAWLDVTMNKGNSGGPVLRLADDAAQDAVIGIANFSLNPFAQHAEEFASVAAAFPGNVVIMGVDFKKFSVLVGAALASQSHGVGGCIAVDYIRLP